MAKGGCCTTVVARPCLACVVLLTHWFLMVLMRKNLENKIKEISEKNVDDSKNDVEDQLRYMTEAKNKAEKEKARLETNLEKMKQLQKEREQRKTIIPDSELKRISSIAKAEQALTLFENNFDVIKNNKSIIKNDVDLKVRVEILSQRFNDFINSLN